MHEHRHSVANQTVAVHSHFRRATSILNDLRNSLISSSVNHISSTDKSSESQITATWLTPIHRASWLVAPVFVRITLIEGKVVTLFPGIIHSHVILESQPLHAWVEPQTFDDWSVDSMLDSSS